jgi:AcrR family transcriptional regulator
MSPKRQRLIDTALDLFYKNGINSIGINEILSVSGVAKRTLYSHFDGKEALIIATLEQRHSTFMRWLEEQLTESQSDKEVIERLFSGLHHWFSHNEPKLGRFRGCFFINTSAEFGDSNHNILHFCSQHKQSVRQAIANHLRSNNELLLDAICIMQEGAIVTAHLTGNTQEVTSRCIEILTTLECSQKGSE